jgi:hypothetical protein
MAKALNKQQMHGILCALSPVLVVDTVLVGALSLDWAPAVDGDEDTDAVEVEEVGDVPLGVMVDSGAHVSPMYPSAH